MMKTLYYSVDVDGNELDLEHDLNYVQDELMVLKILLILVLIGAFLIRFVRIYVV